MIDFRTAKVYAVVVSEDSVSELERISGSEKVVDTLNRFISEGLVAEQKREDPKVQHVCLDYVDYMRMMYKTSMGAL